MDGTTAGICGSTKKRNGSSRKESRWSKGDIFYRLFLGDYCMNPACHKNCKYKYDQSAADIHIGDAWGTKYAKDENGVSSVIVFSEKGQNMQTS